MFFNSLLKTLFVCLRRILISIPYFISLVVCKCPSQIKKLFPVFSVVIFLFLTSCKVNPPPIDRISSKEPDPVKQRECKERGRNNCEGDENCEEICNDIFSNRRDKQECYEYSSEMVSQFENLIKATEDGDVDEIKDIGSEVLECMLDIDERGFAKAIRKMSRSKAQDFVVLIGKDKDFAKVLEEEDDEFNVLKQLVSSVAGSSGLEEALSQEIKDDRTLLWLFSEDNIWAWDWLNGYVGEECNGRDSADCPGGENIGAYCNALLESGFRRGDWEDFLSDADIFAEEYEDEVEGENYEYEITDSPGESYNGDLRDYCELKAVYNGDDNDDQDDDDGDQDDDDGDQDDDDGDQDDDDGDQDDDDGDQDDDDGDQDDDDGDQDDDDGDQDDDDGDQDDDDDDDIPPQAPSPCPTGSPNQILANFQLEVRTYFRIYSHPDYSGSGGNTVQPDFGSASPAQDIVLNMTVHIRDSYDNLHVIVLNEDGISYNRSKTYYIYIDNNRYQLNKAEGYTGNGIKHRRFTPKNYPKNGSLKNVDIAIASEINGDQCEFYTP